MLTVHDLERAQPEFVGAIKSGLSRLPKSIPCRFLYDAWGSRLFEAICRQPEYYLTRTGQRILAIAADEIAAQAGAGAELVELGSGASDKVRLLLETLASPAAYVAIDISRDHLLRAAGDIAADYAGLDVHAVCADYTADFGLPETAATGWRIAFYPGSTIGNFTPTQAKAFLSRWARKLGRGALMLVGVDLRKDAAMLNAAYDDAAGVSAAFILNVLARANREVGADFDLDQYALDARYRSAEGRVAIYLRSLRAQSVGIAGSRFDLARDERIHIEDSWKYTVGGFQNLARRAGYAPMRVWTDAEDLFSVHLLEAGS
jgi:dimethylhistidine N-methyltransferase